MAVQPISARIRAAPASLRGSDPPCSGGLADRVPAPLSVGPSDRGLSWSLRVCTAVGERQRRRSTRVRGELFCPK